MAAGSSPSDTRGIFISNGTDMSGWVTLHSVAMPPECTCSPMTKPSMTVPGSIMDFVIASPSDQKPVGKPGRQAVGADAVCRRGDVIGRAAVCDLVFVGIEHHKGCGGIAVARLSDRAEHGEPLPPAQELHGHAGDRDKARHL